jgi:hypothetical protein
MEKEQHFNTLQDFKNALEKWSVDAKFRYRLKKSEKYARSASLPKLWLLTYQVIIRKRSIIIGAVKERQFYIHAAGVYSCHEQHVIVTSFSDTKFLVDLVACTCSCGRYQVNDIPCGHAVACIIKLQQEPRNYVPEIFILQKDLQTYNRNVLPVDITELEVSLHCRPPILKRLRGRLKERRIRKGEGARKRLRQQAAGGLGDIADHIQRCSGC